MSFKCMSFNCVTRPLVLAALAVLLACTACSKPEPPEKERPPEPQAQRPDEQQASELRDAIRQPIDRAKAVEAQVQDAAAAQQAAIDAQTAP
jgi:hypothetical protein